jgi:DTW domain-containing protein YfiP
VARRPLRVALRVNQTILKQFIRLRKQKSSYKESSSILMRPLLAPHRCPGCEIRKPLCFCAWIPRIELSTRLIVLMHTCEEVLTSNTARLAAKALVHSEVRIHGRKDGRMKTEGLVESGRASLLLFPSPRAVELTPDFVSQLSSPVNLIVPDASWRQTSRFVRHEPAIARIQHVKLMPGPPSEYRLRVQRNEQHLCTLEAIARAIGVLESAEAQSSLEKLLRVMVERTLWSRGKIPASECRESGIPAGT